MANAPKAARVAPEIGAISSDVKMPEKVSTRGSKTEYPFDQLTTVGMSFPVFNKTTKQLSSIVSNQNRKPGAFVLDASGAKKPKMNPMLDAAGATVGHTPALNKKGKPVYETNETDKPHYVAYDASKDDPANDKANKKVVKARIFRDK